MGLSCVEIEDDAGEDRDAPADTDTVEDTGGGEPDAPPDGDDAAELDQPAEDTGRDEAGGEDIEEEEEIPVIPTCEKAGTEERITDDDTDYNDPDIAWSGSQFGLAWENFESTEQPTTTVSLFSNSSALSWKARISVGQTNVKSAG